MLQRGWGGGAAPGAPPAPAPRRRGPGPGGLAPWAASAPGPWVGTAAGRARAEAGLAGSGPPAPSPTLSAPLRVPRSSPPCRAWLPCLTLSPLHSSPPRSPRAPPGLASLLALGVLSSPSQLPSIALPQARSLSILSPSASSLLRRSPLLSRPLTHQLQAIRLDSAFSSALTPSPVLEQPPPKPPSTVSAPSLFRTPPHTRLHLACVFCPFLLPSPLPFSVVPASPDLLCSRAFSLRGGGGMRLGPPGGNGFHARREWAWARLAWGGGEAVGAGGEAGV